MSLINDALQRTRKTQQENPPPAGTPPQFRGVGDAEPQRSNTNVTFGAVIFLFLVSVFLLCGALLLDQMHQRVKARTLASPPLVNPVSSRATIAPKPASKHPGARLGSTVTGAMEGTNSAADIPDLAVAKPPPLRLQAVFFNPARPSAIINGNTVFVGSQIGDSRVSEIGAGRVTLVHEGRATVLKLE